jgi:hypothetical protein
MLEHVIFFIESLEQPIIQRLQIGPKPLDIATFNKHITKFKGIVINAFQDLELCAFHVERQKIDDMGCIRLE